MEARCKKCNNSFNLVISKGKKLSQYTCECGGEYERLQYSAVYTDSPLFDLLIQHRQPSVTRHKELKYFPIYFSANTGVYVHDSLSNKYIKIN